LEDVNGFHMRHIPILEARQGVVDGEYRGSYAPYRLGTPSGERELVKVQLTSHRVPRLKMVVPITRGEADAAVGLHGESRTMRLSEEHKALRVQRIRDEFNRVVPMEDHIERSVGKLAFYPLEHDHKNSATVGPRVDVEALRQFMNV
jgi:hypothetical protein